LVLQRQRAELRDDPALRSAAFRDRASHAVKGGGTGQAGEDVLHGAGDSSRIVDDLDAVPACLPDALRIDIAAHDRPAALHEIAGDGTSHGAKPDDADTASSFGAHDPI